MAKNAAKPIILMATWVVFSLACQLATPMPPTPEAAPPTHTGEGPSPVPTETKVVSASSEEPTATRGANAPSQSSGLAPFPQSVGLASPDVQLKTWKPSGRYAGTDVSLPTSLSQAANPGVVSGLTEAEQAFLTQNGFVVIHSQEAQFNDIREDIAIRYGQPYYLTTDAAYHALHTTFDEMLKALEAQYLRRQMREITQATLDEALSYIPQAKGTSIEADTRLAAAYLATGLKLIDPQAEIDPDLEALVAPQIEQILAGGGQARSVLIPGFEDDYGAYKPVGHYAGRPPLEDYFRGMTWFGRVHFLLKSDEPGFVPSRAPLIITLALRRASLEYQTAAEAWASLHGELAFLIGPSDDAGPIEYAALMDEIYGQNATVQDLAGDARWEEFLASSDRLPAPRINSTFANRLAEIGGEKGWRFMGQRFTLDGFIFQNLVFDKVGTQQKPRELPTGLDVMAAFGSPLAMQILGEMGETSYENYSQQMALLQQAVQAQPEDEWLGTFYSAWLYAFFPQLEPRNASYPSYMQTPAWGYKELNSVLGSWAELKHDTVLYAKMPEMAGGGGPPMSGPAPAYVEPSPEPFYRLAYAAGVIGKHFEPLLMVGEMMFDPPLADDYLPRGLSDYIEGLSRIASQFTQLGDIAVKELTGQAVSSEEYDLISSCMGPLECLVSHNHTPYGLGDTELPPVPVVAAVAGAKQDILEVAVGSVDRIYVIVPLAGKPQVAQGGVFSYYEFRQPRSDRLTDEAWRERLASDPPQQMNWIARFVFSGGYPVDELFFRVGDIYIITQAGDKLNVRQEPSTSASVVAQLHTEDYLEIIDGPVKASGYTWWKVQSAFDTAISGWAVENQEWYKRSTILEE